MSSIPKTILFQGDSITDAGRSRDASGPNSHHGLGTGYAAAAAAGLLADNPAAGLQIYNRGISGNRVTDPLARWRPDALHQMRQRAHSLPIPFLLPGRV